MIRAVHNRICIRFSIIYNMQCIIICNRVCNGNLHVAREFLLCLWTVVIKCDAIVRVFSHFPDDRVKPVFPTVEIIMILILVNPVLFSIDRKPAVFDTISVSSDNRPKVTGMFLISGHVIIPKYKVFLYPFLVRK